VQRLQKRGRKRTEVLIQKLGEQCLCRHIKISFCET
jgi:hypothetical protein